MSSLGRTTLGRSRIRPRALAIGALAVVVLASVLGPRPLETQEIDVPMEVQLPILLKVLAYDRHLPARAPSGVVVAVVFQGGNRTSLLAKESAMRVLEATATVGGVPLRAVAIDLDRTSFANGLDSLAATHAYLTPLRATDVSVLAARAREARVTTMSGVPRHVELGAAIGVGLRGGRPRIFVNVRASRLEGADLSAELLKLAEIVR